MSAHQFDVFLSHNSQDKPIVRKLADKLRSRNLEVWFDEEKLVPGRPWIPELEETIVAAKSIAVLVGANGFGPWEHLEVQACLNEFVRRDLPIIPVLLPGFPDDGSLPPLLKIFTWIDLRPDFSAESLDKLVWGISGESVSNSGTTERTDRVFNVPHPENPYFTGRESQLRELRQRFESNRETNHLQAIRGLGGMGKSALATRYAYRFQERYRAVFWIRSDTTKHIKTGFLEIAKALGVEHEKIRPAQMVQNVKDHLEKLEDWLIIFDNADRLEILKDFLPNRRPGHILLTSRAQKDFDKIGIPLPMDLPKFWLGQGTDFLLRRTEREINSTERPFAEAVAKDIDGLPLALEQAGAFILAKSVSFERYAKNYSSARSHINLLDKQAPVAGQYNSTVATTWLLNFAEVEKESAASAEILRLSSFMDPDFIPFEMVIKGAAEISPELHKMIEGADDAVFAVADALQPLVRYSLVNIDQENESYSMHRLVQEALKARYQEGVQ